MTKAKVQKTAKEMIEGGEKMMEKTREKLDQINEAASKAMDEYTEFALKNQSEFFSRYEKNARNTRRGGRFLML